MKKMNFGCGPDIKEGWTNVDVVLRPNVFIWNGMDEVTRDGRRIEPQLWDYDFILVNHVLCTMKPEEVGMILHRLYDTLKPGGDLVVIDMDLEKVFAAYKEGRYNDLPIEHGTPDARLCNAISGYGTRNSLYTPIRMYEVLAEAGFRLIEQVKRSEYDTRPKESLIFEATK
jgi:predicted SAM-dependent methyltransferase